MRRSRGSLYFPLSRRALGARKARDAGEGRGEGAR